MIAFDIEALVDSIGETRTRKFADGQKQYRELLLRDPEPREGSKYPAATLCVTFWGDRVADLDRLMPNDAVRVRACAKSVQKEGQDRSSGRKFAYYATRVSGIECECLRETAPYEAERGARTDRGRGGYGGRNEAPPPPREEAPRRYPDDDEDVPF